MDRAKIFQSVIKGTNVFTPIIDSYHTVGNHIIELSCSEKDNQHGLYLSLIHICIAMGAGIVQPNMGGMPNFGAAGSFNPTEGSAFAPDSEDNGGLPF